MIRPESRTPAEHAVARLDEIGEMDDGRIRFRAVRHHFGIRTFGINAMTARAEGDRLIGEHAETEPDSSEELYVVVSGHATFEIDGKTQEAAAGTLVHVPAGVKRSAVARDADTTVLAIGGGSDGKPYKPSGWEAFAPLFPLFESGDYEQGADRAEALLADDPSYGASVYYNTACFESRAGRTEAAIAHLRRAVELEPSNAELAREDEDFATLHENPAFGEIVAPISTMSPRISGIRQPSVWASVVSDDALALHDWLLVLGFTEDLMIPGERKGLVHHCQLDWPEGGRVLLSSTGERSTPCRPGTSSLHVVTSDPDAVMERALSIGAMVVHPLVDQTDYPSRDCTVADPDGNHWTFATFAG